MTHPDGQTSVLHTLVFDKSVGQAIPPYTAGVIVLVCMPPPQYALQVLHSPIIQSTGQGCNAHGLDSDNDGHVAPPFAAALVTVLVRDCDPVPHVPPLQSLHAPQSDTTQSIGHACVLHACVLDKSVGQGIPLPVGGEIIRRVCVCVPPPQDVLHELHGVQSDITQFLFGSGGLFCTNR
jgi:hypothetical protein